VFDSGDYPGALQKALDALGGIDAFRSRQRAARDEGRYLGLGIGCYNEGTGVGPFEGATVRIENSGKDLRVVGRKPAGGRHGDGILTDRCGSVEGQSGRRQLSHSGDTAGIPMGFGTIASRSTVTVSSALHYAANVCATKPSRSQPSCWNVRPMTWNMRQGGIGIVGVPGKTLTLGALAQAARPGWDRTRPPNMEAGLEDQHTITNRRR